MFFKLLTREEKIKLVSSIFKDNELKIKSNNLFIKINDKNCQIIFATHFDSLNQKNLIDLLDEQAFDADKYIVICCENATTNKNLYTNKEIEIIDKTKLYDLMEENDCLIKGENINSKIDKSNFKDLLSMVFARSKAKSYFFCGLILIFSSIILPYHFYYLVFGSMLLLFSIICKVWKRRKA